MWCVVSGATTTSRWSIAGDQGTFTGAVTGELARAGLAEHSRVIGHVTNDDLVALYTAAAVFVFTSAYEGFGLPPLEAMACGTPAVVFDNSSLREVSGGAASLVPDGDAGAMAACDQPHARRRAERESGSDPPVVTGPRPSRGVAPPR